MKRLSVILAGAMLLAGAATATAQGGPPVPERHVQGRLLVQPRPGLPLAELDRIVKPHGGRRGPSIRQINVHVIELPQQANLHAIAAALRRNRHIKFAEVDGVVPAGIYPNDPRYPNEWHLPKVGAPAAWDLARGDGVTVAILDSGVDGSHEDFQGRLVPGWNFYDNNNDTSDVYGHGTAVAGIAGAAANNGLGVASVGYGARIMPIRVTDTSGYGYYSMMASGIIWAADGGARVANLSFLGVSISSTVDSAAQYMRGKGGVVVVSAGNTGAARSDPLRSSLTAVAATDQLDARASFSSWGDYVDVAAPGVGLWTTWNGGSYAGMSGTSASAPVIAGTYALILSAKSTLSPAALDDILFTTAVDLGSSGWDQEFGHGRVNAAAAVAKALQTSTTDFVPPTVAITSPTGGSASGLVPVDVTATDDTGVARVELFANNALVATDTSSPYGFTLDASKYGNGSLTLVARAYDAANNAGDSAPVTLTLSNDKVPPTVSILSPSSGSTVSGTVTVSVAAFDDVKVAKVSLTIDGREVALSYSSSLKYSWSVPRVKGKGKGAASSTLVARAEDAGGNAATASITVSRQ